MTVLAEIMDGIRTQLLTIDGMRSSATMPDNPSPPFAYPFVQSIDYDQAMHKGLVVYNIGVQVLVSRVAERSGQDRLYGFLASTGTASVKAAIEADRTLGSAVFDLRVSEALNVGNVTLGAGDIAYLSAEWSVQVYAL